MRARSVATVEPLLAALEDAGLAPTIARNYERFPDFGHDLDICIREAKDTATPIFARVAQELGWDYLTVCTHYMNVVAYRFQHLDPPETFHVDVICSLTLWGQTLVAASDLCATRQRDPSGRFSHFEGVWENGYRLFQIESLIGAVMEDQAKIERYRQQAMRFDACHVGALAGWGRRTDLLGIEDAMVPLRACDYGSFARLVNRAKRGFVIRRLLRNPALVVGSAAKRAWWLVAEKLVAPCGPAIELSEADRELWQSVLDRLVEAQFLNGWTTTTTRLRECQWAFVAFVSHGEAFRDLETSFASLAKRLVYRHRMAHAKRG